MTHNDILQKIIERIRENRIDDEWVGHTCESWFNEAKDQDIAIIKEYIEHEETET